MAKIKLQNVRLSHPKLFTAEAFKGGDGPKKYSASFHLDPSIPGHKKAIKAIKAEFNRIGAEKWPDKWKNGKMKLKGYALKSYDEDIGDEEQFVSLTVPESGETPEGMDGIYIFSASESTRPTLVDQHKNPVTEDDKVLYEGCYVTALVNVWPQDNKWGKRLNANLIGVQFKKDGEPFGEGGEKASDDDFDDDDFDDEDEDL